VPWVELAKMCALPLIGSVVWVRHCRGFANSAPQQHQPEEQQPSLRSGSRLGPGSLCGSESAHCLTNLGDLFHIEVGSREFE